MGKRNAQRWGKWELGGRRRVGRVQCAWPDRTGVFGAGEGGQDAGGWSGASQALGDPGPRPRTELLGCQGRRSRAAWGSPSAPAREQLRARGPGPLFGALITPARLPRALRARQAGGRPWRWRGAAARGCLPSRSGPHPWRTANGAQPALGLSGVSLPKPISPQSAFPKSCKQPPWPVLGRGGEAGWVGRGRWGRGWGHPPYRSLPWMRLPW